MSISVTGKLNKAANQFQAGESKGFGVRVGVKFYNRETKAQEWTNYEAVVFAKAGAQSDFYESALVEGSVIEVSGSGGQIKTWESTNGPVHSIAILDAKIGYVLTNDQNAPQSSGQAPQPIKQESFDSDIPF
jgi:single-strand DNA-binding protein